MGRPHKYSDELRRRAVEEVLERGRKIPDVARDLGIGSPETLRKWVRRAEVDQGLRQAPTTEELAEIKALRKEVWPTSSAPSRSSRRRRRISRGRPTRDSGDGLVRG